MSSDSGLYYSINKEMGRKPFLFEKDNHQLAAM